MDGYFYGIHDNGASVALNMALARHYAQVPLEQRRHGIIFLFQGDHEVPGVGGTLPFIDKHRTLMQENLLLVLRPEHLGMIRPLDEGIFVGSSNITDPLMLLVTNRSPVLIDIFKRAITDYAIPTGDLVYIDPAADEAAFHPPFNDLDAISSGWIQTGKKPRVQPEDAVRAVEIAAAALKSSRASIFTMCPAPAIVWRVARGKRAAITSAARR